MNVSTISLDLGRCRNPIYRVFFSFIKISNTFVLAHNWEASSGLLDFV